MAAKITLDSFDKKILDCLQDHADMALAEIARRVGLSTTPCWRRINRLQEAGIIKARVALLERKAVNAGVTVFVGWWMERIPVLGYTPLMLVVTFFGGLTALGLGIVGQYLWLTLQNARRRPNYIVRSVQTTGADAPDHRRTSDRNVS